MDTQLSVLPESRPRALVLGIGNVLWADEGFGVRAVERFFSRFAPLERLDVVDGGTRGMALLPLVQETDLLIVFDAVDFDLAPGTLHHLVDAEVPAFLGVKKMSLHQTGFQDVLALAELTGEAPRHLHLIGVQPALLEDYGGGLTETVAARIDAAIEIAAGRLAAHGFALRPRTQALDTGDLGPAALARDLYEGKRPSEAEACRIGDARFLVMRAP